MNKNLKLVFSILIILIIMGLGAYFFGFRGRVDYGKGEVSINGKTFKVEVADTMRARAQGLSGREGMGEDYGMIFIFSTSSVQGFWMKDMKFPLDMVWIKGDRVVGFTENVQPELEKSVFGLTIYHSPEAVDKVLELNAGAVAKYGIKEGDLVYLNR